MIFYLPWLFDDGAESAGTARCVAIELALSFPFAVSLQPADGLSIAIEGSDGFGVMLDTDDGLTVGLDTEEGYDIEIGGLCSNQ